MTNKIMIDDYKNTIKRLQQECREKTDNILQLGEQLQRKTTECEELKVKYERIKKDNGLLFDKAVDARKDNTMFMGRIEELTHKLQLATEALQFYADMEEVRETKEQGSDRWVYVIDDNYGSLANEALEQLGVENDRK